MCRSYEYSTSINIYVTNTACHETHKKRTTVVQVSLVLPSKQNSWTLCCSKASIMFSSAWFKQNSKKAEKPERSSCLCCKCQSESTKRCTKSHCHNIGSPTDVTLHYHVTKNDRSELEGIIFPVKRKKPVEQQIFDHIFPFL